MDTSAGSGVGWRPQPQWKEEEEEEEGEPMGSGSPNRGLQAGRSMDQWNVSPFSEEMLEDVGLPEELKDFCGPLEEEDELDDDLSELQDLESLGESEPASPLSGRVKEGADIGRLGSVSHWHPQRDRQQQQEEEEEEEAWAEGSEREPSPELSYEGLYGSEFSASPEALQDPLAVYNSHSKPSRFNSDGEEEGLSGNSKLTSSPARTPLEGAPFERAVVGTRGQGGTSQGFLEEREFSSGSQKSPEHFGPASPVGSIRWSCSPLGGLSLEDLQNSPSLDSESFPESSWVENVAHPEGNGLEVATSSTALDPQTPKKPKESRLEVKKATGGSGALNKQGHHLPERAWGLNAEAPGGRPTKTGQQSRSLSPQRATSCRRTGGLGSNGSFQASPSTLAVNDPLPYGRGQLNHPLPDLSKVEPRVRFPRDPHSYHPPRGRTLPARSKDSGRPVVFKSPAEIVREVLLSSGEGPPQKHPAAAISMIPEELKSPRQATELVRQLQEDYRKLLTKYAEAENTIDRLRLGAKVRLYSDPPKPSHGVQMGTVSNASQVMTFSIPQIRAAEVTGRPDPVPDVAVSQGFSGQAGASASPSNPEGPAVHREDGFTTPDQPFSGEELSWALAAQASKFCKQPGRPSGMTSTWVQKAEVMSAQEAASTECRIFDKVESLEELICAGKLSPRDQLKGFARLKGVQDALEQAYLQAREDHRQQRKHLGPEGVLGDFDPDRALEGEIFRQGMWLEELRERIERSTARNSAEAASPPPSPFLPQDPERQMGPPAPSPQAPIPASHTPYPEAVLPESSCHGDQLDLGVSSSGDEPAEDVQELPEPLRARRQEVERGFDRLLEHYKSLKAFPGSFSLDQLHPNGEEVSPEEVDGAAAGGAGRKDIILKTMSRNQGTPTSPSSMREPQLNSAPHQLWPEMSPEIGHAPGAQREVPISPELAEKSKTSASEPRRSRRKQPECCSPPSSTASIAGSSVPESVTLKPFRKANTASAESPWLVPSEAHTEPLGDVVGISSQKHQDIRMVSPETDSGFVGSEASRMSPLVQMPKSRSTPWRPRGALRRAAMAKGTALSDPQQKVSRVVEPSEMDVSPRHNLPARGLQRQHPALGHAFHARAPPGIARKVEPSGESPPSDSEAEGGLSAGAPLPEEMGRFPGASDTPLPSPGRTGRSSFLDSRLERDQAIAALQSEVSQLWRSLEVTLCRPHNPATHPSSPHTLRRQVPHRGAACFSTRAKEMCKTSENSMSELEPLSPPIMDPEAWAKKPLVPPREAQENPDSSESGDLTPKLQKGKQQETSVPRAKFLKQTVLRGPYTGARYPLPAREAQGPRALRGPPPCSHSPGASPQLQGGPPSAPAGQEMEGGDPQVDAAPPSQCPTRKEGEAKPCLLCRERGSPSGGALQQAYVQGKEQQQACKSGTQAKLHQPPAAQPPCGLCHTVASTPATSIPCIPVVPYPLLSTVMQEDVEQPMLSVQHRTVGRGPLLAAHEPRGQRAYSPRLFRTAEPVSHWLDQERYSPLLATASAASLAGLPVYDANTIRATELKTGASGWQLRDCCGPQPSDSKARLQDLNRSLRHAMEAARDLKVTSHRMSRSLAWELSQVKSLRGPCLF